MGYHTVVMRRYTASTTPKIVFHRNNTSHRSYTVGYAHRRGYTMIGEVSKIVQGSQVIWVHRARLRPGVLTLGPWSNEGTDTRRQAAGILVDLAYQPGGLLAQLQTGS